MSQVNFIKSSTMKSIICAVIFALALLTGVLSAPTTASAQTSAEGSFRYSLEDGLTKAIEFAARGNGDGTASGRITFSGPAEFPEQEEDAGFSGRLEDLQITAEIDGMATDRNRAVMSGVVTGSTLSDYIGQRVLLIVEDNGDGIARAGDKFSWGLYKPHNISWIPADAELREDNGWSMTWIATDAEQRDDEGIQITRDWVRNCQSFPLSSYDFVDVTEGEGNIQVQP